MKHVQLRWWAVVAWIACITLFSSAPFSFGHSYGLAHAIVAKFGLGINSERLADLILVVRKAAHVTEYAVLAWLLSVALQPAVSRPPAAEQLPAVQRKRRMLILAGVILVALGDELRQRLVPGRLGQLSDVGFDVLGGLLFLGLSHLRSRSAGASADPSGSRLTH